MTNRQQKQDKIRESMERQLSFNQGARIKDSRDPVEENFDDEKLDDVNFEHRASVDPLVFAEPEPEPDANEELLHRARYGA